MKKGLIILGLFMSVLLIAGIFVTATDSDVGKEIIDEIPNEEIAGQVSDYVESFVEKKNINPEKINSISEVDFESLPKEVNIENVDDTNLAIYEVDYDDSGEEKKVFVITYSVEKLRAQGDLIIAHDKRQFLNFGFDGEMIESGFLETATGVEGSLEKGYVMMRKGSITAISTNLEAIEGVGKLRIVIYKNGKQIEFGNEILVDSAGVKKDYDVQSNDVVTFEPGDLISAYVYAEGDLRWQDVVTLVEITTN